MSAAQDFPEEIGVKVAALAHHNRARLAGEAFPPFTDQEIRDAYAEHRKGVVLRIAIPPGLEL